MGDLCVPLPFRRQYHCTAKSLRSTPTNKDLKTKWPLVPKGVSKVTDPCNHRSSLTNTCFFLDRLDNPSFDACPYTTYNARHPSMWGTGPWVRGWAHGPILSPTHPIHIASIEYSISSSLGKLRSTARIS